MSVGNIVVHVPENFDGKYRTKAEDSGEVFWMPKTGKTIGNTKIEQCTQTLCRTSS